MKKLQVSMLAGAVMGLFTSANAQASTTDSISQFGLNYTITDNQAAQHGTDCAALGADWASCNKAVITLTNPGDAVCSAAKFFAPKRIKLCTAATERNTGIAHGANLNASQLISFK